MSIENFCDTNNEVFNGEPWFGESIVGSLQKVSLEYWTKKPENTTNSIASIVCHMIDWRYFVVEKLKGNASFDIPLNTKEDWRENVVISSEEDKEKIFLELRDSQEELIKLIKEKKDTWLQEITPGKEYTNDYMLQGILQHDVYHLGQINVINSQLKNL